MATAFKGAHAHDGMRMIGRAAHNRIQIILLQHLPKIPITLGIGKLLGGSGEIFLINIAQGSNVGLFHRSNAAQITTAAAGNPNNADV